MRQAAAPLRESNWKRSVRWSAAKAAAGIPTVHVHDLRHTAASLWLAARAHPKVVQRVLGHATATMTMDLYGHLVDANLWHAARPWNIRTTACDPRPDLVSASSGARNPAAADSHCLVSEDGP